MRVCDALLLAINHQSLVLVILDVAVQLSHERKPKFFRHFFLNRTGKAEDGCTLGYAFVDGSADFSVPIHHAVEHTVRLLMQLRCDFLHDYCVA